MNDITTQTLRLNCLDTDEPDVSARLSISDVIRKDANTDQTI